MKRLGKTGSVLLALAMSTAVAGCGMWRTNTTPTNEYCRIDGPITFNPNRTYPALTKRLDEHNVVYDAVCPEEQNQ